MVGADTIAMERRFYF